MVQWRKGYFTAKGSDLKQFQILEVVLPKKTQSTRNNDKLSVAWWLGHVNPRIDAALGFAYFHCTITTVLGFLCKVRAEADDRTNTKYSVERLQNLRGAHPPLILPAQRLSLSTRN